VSSTRNGTLLYDGSCAFCTRWVTFWRGLFARYGIDILTLQAAAAEGLVPAGPALLRDVRLLLASGASIVGADAYLAIMDRIWWARPLAMLLRFPPLHALVAVAYRAFADNRYCVAGTCRIDAGNTLTAEPSAKNAEAG
jgi:predicted DCC family thiol-disulfide oxidoreductase YuxK